MAETSLEQERGCWRVSEHPIKIEYSSRVLADLDRDVIEGFHRLKRGGVEVGGVLLGTRNDRTVTVLDYRPFDCEHALGPGFALSTRDHEALVTLLQSLQAQGLVAVGWYHSNNRSHIHLSPPDLEVFDRHFPEPWQIALLLKPDSFAPTKAGFFVREEDGSIRADSSYQEFSLPPRNVPAGDRKTDRDLLIERAAMSRPVLPPPPSPPKSAIRKPILIGALAAVAMTLVVIGFSGKEKTATPRNELALTLHDNQGHLQIGWNRAATAISRHPSGMLEVKDGDHVTLLDLHGDQLQRGTVVYDRTSPNVVVNLKVGGATETAVFAGPPVDAPRQERIREAADVPERLVTRQPVQIKRARSKPPTAIREEEVPALKRPPSRRG